MELQNALDCQVGSGVHAGVEMIAAEGFDCIGVGVQISFLGHVHVGLYGVPV